MRILRVCKEVGKSLFLTLFMQPWYAYTTGCEQNCSGQYPHNLSNLLNLIIRVFIHKQSYYMTANKSGSAGNDYVLHIVIIFIILKSGARLSGY